MNKRILGMENGEGVFFDMVFNFIVLSIFLPLSERVLNPPIQRNIRHNFNIIKGNEKSIDSIQVHW